jgi:hypothetical protein
VLHQRDIDDNDGGEAEESVPMEWTTAAVEEAKDADEARKQAMARDQVHHQQLCT